jgi:hypothetical protein
LERAAGARPTPPTCRLALAALAALAAVHGVHRVLRLAAHGALLHAVVLAVRIHRGAALVDAVVVLLAATAAAVAAPRVDGVGAGSSSRNMRARRCWRPAPAALPRRHSFARFFLAHGARRSSAAAAATVVLPLRWVRRNPRQPASSGAGAGTPCRRSASSDPADFYRVPRAPRRRAPFLAGCARRRHGGARRVSGNREALNTMRRLSAAGRSTPCHCGGHFTGSVSPHKASHQRHTTGTVAGRERVHRRSRARRGRTTR